MDQTVMTSSRETRRETRSEPRNGSDHLNFSMVFFGSEKIYIYIYKCHLKKFENSKVLIYYFLEKGNRLIPVEVGWVFCDFRDEMKM